MQASGVGSLLASAVAAVLHLALGEAEVARWGWRLPFGLGGLIALFTCVVRRNFGATEEFEGARRDGRLVDGERGDVDGTQAACRRAVRMLQ